MDTTPGRLAPCRAPLTAPRRPPPAGRLPPAAAPAGAQVPRMGAHLRPGWLLPARIRRTRSGRPSRQLRAVDTRRICPPCTDKGRSSGATALPTQPADTAGPPATAARREVSAAGAHPLHDAAVYLHPLSVHGWR